MSVPVPARRFQRPWLRLNQPARRDIGLISLSIVGVGAAYFVTSESSALATLTALGLATAAGMHGRLAMGRVRVAIQIFGTAAVLAALGAPARLIGALLITGMAAAELIVSRAHRSAILRVSAWVAVIAFLTSLSGTAATLTLPPRVVGYEAVAAAIGGFLSAPLMLMLAPLAEGLFGHITRLTMSEWLSYEHPLLRQLASAAPGTFQHSVNVGVLADAAAGSIGADALLARVGGLYHDVGKMNAPEYFVENQRAKNPHDDLAPSESARIFRAHVLDGVDLVHRHRMGQRLADFVREHHGTSQMRSLRDKAEGIGEPFDDEIYRYPGPRPQSRETGLLMIADQLEATARANAPADEAQCDALVRTTMERLVSEQQLDDSRLTIGDLAGAERGFSRALQAMYHRRLSYPSSDDKPDRPRLVFPRRRRRTIAS